MSRKTKVSDMDLYRRLMEQRDFLVHDLQAFEKGWPHFSIKMAGTLRTIFGNPPLLPNLAERHNILIQFRMQDPRPVQHLRQTGFKPLFGIAVPFVFHKDGRVMGDPGFHRKTYLDVSFDDYWKEEVLILNSIRFKRSEIIITCANKLGGAHVAPVLPKDVVHAINDVTIAGQKGIVFDITVHEMSLQVAYLLAALKDPLKHKITGFFS